MTVVIRSMTEFNRQLEAAGTRLVSVDFSAEWYGPCKKIAPRFEQLAINYGDRAVFLRVDVDQCKDDIATKFRVSQVPAFVFFKNKAQVDRFSGANIAKLEEVVRKHMITS